MTPQDLLRQAQQAAPKLANAAAAAALSHAPVKAASDSLGLTKETLSPDAAAIVQALGEVRDAVLALAGRQEYLVSCPGAEPPTITPLRGTGL